MKKIISVALSAMLVLGMGLTTFAANDKVKAFESGKTLASGLVGYKPSGQTLDLGTIHPIDEVKVEIDLRSDMFTPAVGTSGKNLTAAVIRSSKLQIRSTSRAGSKLLSELKIDTKDAQIEAKFIKEMISTKDQDFEIELYLTIDGKRMSDETITIIGTMENEVVPVYENYDYIDLSRQLVAEAEDFVNKIEVDLGNGVSIYTKLFKGKKYYGTASRDTDEADDVVFKKYPDIDNVVTLKTVGLNSTGDIVRLDNDYDNYYVYDSGLNFIGMSNEMLPFSSKYYLANKELDVDDEDIDETDDTDDADDLDEDYSGEGEGGETGSAVTEGGGNGGGNASGNPDTGVNGFMGVAVAAALLSLAGIGALSLKRKK